MIPVSRFFTAQDPSNALLSYTQKGIDFFEILGQFSKEKATIEEEYSIKLKNLAKKYAKKAEDDDEILKNLSYMHAFNLYLQQLDQIAGKHHSTAENIREDVVTYVASKTCQLRSSRKNAMTDLKTINEQLEEQINNMYKAGKAYIKSFKDAESAYQKFYKADKNLEISRLELEKARNHASIRNEASDKAKVEYSQSVSSANQQQKRYHEELLPVIFAKLKAIDKECISDMSHVLQKVLHQDQSQAVQIENCRTAMETIISRVSPESDAQLVLQSVEATIKRPSPFDLEDLGDPKECENRSNDSHDGKQRSDAPINSFSVLKSPGKRRIMKNLLGKNPKDSEVKKQESLTKEAYTDKDKPPHVRLSCLRSKIKDMEKQLEQAVQGREGITRLQKAYYANPQHGNPEACTEPLIAYAKKIETLNTSIQNLKEFYTLLEMSVEGMPTERSFGGRDTPDTTRSISGCSTNLSSSKTLEDGVDYCGSAQSTPLRRMSSLDDSGKNMFLQFISSPKRLISSPKMSKSPQVNGMVTPVRRKKDISSPVLRSSFSGAIRKISTTPSMQSPSRSISSPKRIDQITTAMAMFCFEKTSAETMSIEQGDELLVQEMDNGDGWTRARNKKSQEIGFVPTSYLQFPVPSSLATPP